MNGLLWTIKPARPNAYKTEQEDNRCDYYYDHGYRMDDPRKHWNQISEDEEEHDNGDEKLDQFVHKCVFKEELNDLIYSIHYFVTASRTM